MFIHLVTFVQTLPVAAPSRGAEPWGRVALEALIDSFGRPLPSVKSRKGLEEQFAAHAFL